MRVLASGALFGLGLAMPGMTDARRVPGFLDVFGEFRLQGGLRYYFETPGDGPDWGLRMSLTLLYPKQPAN